VTVEVHYVADGPEDAPPVVLAGSLGSTLAMWEPQVAALARDFRVIRYDHRGHGGSPCPSGRYTLEDLAGDAVALFDRLELDRASFCGLSLGGMVGMWLGAHAPQRIDRLALCCTSPYYGPAMWDERAALVRDEGTAAVADATIERWFTPEFADKDRFHRMLVETSSDGYAGCCDAIGGMDLRADLPSIIAPTLVIAGEDDPATPPEVNRAIADAIPGAHYEVVGPARHLANVEQADKVNELLRDHFARGERT
jgi:3-oxoadipate enol-lactonase